jgi:hypothetical protein
LRESGNMACKGEEERGRGRGRKRERRKEEEPERGRKRKRKNEKEEERERGRGREGKCSAAGSIRTREENDEISSLACSPGSQTIPGFMSACNPGQHHWMCDYVHWISVGDRKIFSHEPVHPREIQTVSRCPLNEPNSTPRA